MECLEHKPDRAVAQVCQLVLILSGDILAVQIIFPGTWYIQAADDVHQRTLARSGRSHDHKIFSLFHFQIDIKKNRDGKALVFVALIHIFQL